MVSCSHAFQVWKTTIRIPNWSFLSISIHTSCAQPVSSALSFPPLSFSCRIGAVLGMGIRVGFPGGHPTASPTWTRNPCLLLFRIFLGLSSRVGPQKGEGSKTSLDFNFFLNHSYVQRVDVPSLLKCGKTELLTFFSLRMSIAMANAGGIFGCTTFEQNYVFTGN